MLVWADYRLLPDMALFHYERNFNNYRLSLLVIVLRVFVVPCLLAQAVLALSIVPTVHDAIKWLVVYPLSIALYWSVRNTLWTLHDTRDAARRGAHLIPKVHGRWPGGLDLMLYFALEAENGYGTLEFRKFFEDRGATTLNFQMLWHDFIMTIDEGHIKHVLATGFNHFEKGQRGRYIMCVRAPCMPTYRSPLPGRESSATASSTATVTSGRWSVATARIYASDLPYSTAR